MPDFDEHYLYGLPMETGSDPNRDTCDVYMNLGIARGSEMDQPPDNGVATLRFVGKGLEMSLVAVPFASLKRLARFIRDTVKHYEEKTND